MDRQPKFHPFLDPASFEKTHAGFMTVISPESDFVDAFSESVQLEPEEYLRLKSFLDAAADAHRSGFREEAWSFLTVVAENIGRHIGKGCTTGGAPAEVSVNDALRSYGQRGGIANRRNFAKLRDRAAAALLKITPPGGWPSKQAFELAYNTAVREILGEHDTEHQRKAIVKRPDIRSTLPRTLKRRR